ncbi:MAG: dolichol-phosphate mannosyltransferase, partial [Cyanobacteria bacterium J06598_3]
QLATALTEQGESEFLYVCYPHRDCPTPATPASELALEGGQAISFEELGTFGKYPMYTVKIAE